jgi:hypothetical protein
MGKGISGYIATLLLVSLTALGCGGKDADPEYMNQLRAFAKAYHSYADSTKMSPATLADLKPDWAAFPRVREDIESDQFVVAWGVSLERSAAENDRYVLGYEVDVPQNGGLVLLGGGTVRQVSAEEFAQLGRFKPQGKRGE